MPTKKAKKVIEKKEEAIPSTEVEDSSLSMVDLQIVKPVVSPEQALTAWRAYQKLKRSLLDPTDYQTIYIFETGRGRIAKPFVKKSGWRKLATAFNLSVELVSEVRKEYNQGKPNAYFAIEITAKAIAMNGRYMVGTGTCASNERTFAHLEHDIRATAETRAKNRAISDLIGGGDVSAEEVMQQTEVKQGNCEINHANLPEQSVKTKDSKNFGRGYVRCDLCKYFKWTSDPALKAEELPIEAEPEK